MDHIIAPFRSRVDSRNHRHAQYTLTEKELDRRTKPYEEEEDYADEPLLIREHKRRTVMSNSHRRFHRRAPQAGTNVKTVNVEVVATLDTAGNVVAQTTVTQPDSTVPTEASQVLPVTNATDVSAPSATPEPSAPTAAAATTVASTLEVPSIASLPSETQPTVPSTPSEPSQASVPSVSAEPTVATVVALPSVASVPAVSSVSLPSVPSVPAFPSTLTVPAYPFASSSVGAVVADAVAASSSASSAAASIEPSIVAALTAASTTNSTVSSISSTTSSIASSILASSPTLLSTMMAASRTAISSGTSPSVSSQSGSSPSTAGSSNRATPTDGGPGWAGGSGAATAGSPASGTTPLDTPRVVGSVVGSLAGAALILAIILVLLRRHKRRQGGALQLTDSHPADNEQAMRQVQAPAPARASLVPSAFLNRFSGLSRSTADTSSPTERSFQRVSGRKLPSAFSEGMTSDQFARGGHTSDPFYQDDHGTCGGPGMNKEYGGGFGKEIGETSFTGGAGTLNLRPSPARTPVIRHPNENPFDDTNRSTLSPPMSPNPFSSPNHDLPPRAALGRSLHSADGSRSSRFTENV
ncbi:hypothetical protein BU25DRAFT_431075 [Macroventuria anomochaeta]|uniref:Uncharacterized protein n=1 Tax=Macroventuria anomochaeta TaxID=301207 RepID=A0ACB6S222_9PLEO|nr:uncharacterized protein BU25DRAFT_431075 [Macroventuria anomochaeta]KAF2628290.1 hypothetical protein BU25DRAFT_431075 [Macroventuria anomochaeta]